MNYYNKDVLHYKFSIYLNQILRESLIQATKHISKIFPNCIEAINILSKKILIDPISIVTARTTHGFKMIMDVDRNEIENEIYYMGSYDTAFLDVINKLIKPNDETIEIGTNGGFYSLYLSTLIKNGKIHCIEENDRSFDKLQKNIFMNGITSIIARKLQNISFSNIYNFYKKLNINNPKLIIINNNKVVEFLKDLIITENKSLPTLYIRLCNDENYDFSLNLLKKFLDSNIYKVYEVKNFDSIPLKKIEHAGDLLFCQNILCMTEEDIEIINNNKIT